nr:hypothetical protein [Methylomarinum sp. Ch1-1]MDP4522303.1 hypothetical protein [Methylomarinum sp. Ch1-1]
MAEVFVGLIEHSDVSLLAKQADLSFSMPQLLAAVGDINPLGR